MKRTVIVATIGLAAVGIAGCSGAARDVPEARLVSTPIGSTTEPRTITGVGLGEVKGTPDTLTLQLGVESRADSATEALRRSSEQTEKVLRVLRDAGVGEDDVQTSGLSVYPEFGEKGEEIIGYVATNSVSVTSHALDRAGEMIDAAAGEVGDDIRIDGVWFSIEDTSALVEAARADAVKRASEQARQLAEAAGVELGAIRTIEEHTSPDYDAEVAADAGRSAASPVPIEPGTQELAVSVTVVYEIV